MCYRDFLPPLDHWETAFLSDRLELPMVQLGTFIVFGFTKPSSLMTITHLNI
ncbi:MAG: hypothetical protein HeimC2_22540 [Candidatus Heimdallarchaeota archaeon LC_2]|nr:MAG: hypothetical protein HeimC2_22540 [Candidatus Heimdallarchaeota archaeon LC_2]